MDAYPEIRKKAPDYFGSMSEYGLFMEIFKHFGYMPITSDSHFGEYIHWAQEVSDHKGILDFYFSYKKSCLRQRDPMKRLKYGTRPIDYWRTIPIIEGIINDSGHEELAVNVPNKGLIPNIPENIVVEVPAMIDKNGVHPIALSGIPIGFGALLNNRVGILTLTAEAAILGSKEIAMQALLVDPTINSIKAAEKVFETILNYQAEYLGYLK
jgi:alpha-galactosidase